MTLTRRRSVWAALRTVLLAVLLVAGLLTGCATVPNSGAPVDYTRVAAPGNQDKESAPADGLSPLEIVRGFIAASARIDQDPKLSAARSYLAPAVKNQWQLQPADVQILSAVPRFDLKPDDPEVVQLSGFTDGKLSADGAYVPAPSRMEYEVDITVVDVGGQWRIADPPTGLIISVGDFNVAFTQRQVYFVNSTSTLLVPDRRWLPNQSQNAVTMADRLLSRLISGPSAGLAAAVRTELNGARLRVPITAGADGVLQVELTGMGDLTSANARVIAAQLVFTLRSDAANIRILVDGAPLNANQPAWTTGVLGSFDPDGIPGSGSVGAAAYYLNSIGALRSLPGTPVWGTAGTGELGGVSAAMSAATGAVAIVGPSAEGQSLYIGEPLVQKPMAELFTATSFTPPSFSRTGDEIWTVIDAATKPQVVRLLPAGTSYPVDSASLATLGTVSDLSLSPDGVHVALVAMGKLYMSTVVYPEPSGSGSVEPGSGGANGTLTTPVLLRPELTVEHAVWADSQNLLVTATDNLSTYQTVWQIGLDGRQRSALTTRGIVADVDAIAVTRALPVLISSGGQIYQLRGDNAFGDWVPADPAGGIVFGSWPVYPT